MQAAILYILLEGVVALVNKQSKELIKTYYGGNTESQGEELSNRFKHRTKR